MPRSILAAPRQMKKPSVRDVAQAAGVSISSVSRVLNGNLSVNPDIAARVLAAADELGYHPDANARGLRMGVSKTVGCLIPDIANPLYASYVSAIEARLQEEGYMLLLGSSRGQVSRERELIRVFESRGMDGIIAAVLSESDPDTNAMLRRCSVPVVIEDRDVGDDFDAAVIDHSSGIRRALEYLFSLGHDRVALFTPGAVIRPGKERIRGYEEAHAAAGRAVDTDLVVTVNPRLYSTYDDMSRLLSMSQPPTAVIGLSTQILAGALRAIRERGLRIPQDMSVIGIGTSESLAYVHPALTHLRIDVDANGRTVAEIMLERLAMPDKPPKRVTRSTELVIADSCAPVRSSAQRTK